MSDKASNVQTGVGIPKKRMYISLLLTCIFGVSVLGSVSASETGKDERKTFSVEPGTVLKIYNDNGNIDISGWDGNEIEVDIVTKGKPLFGKAPTVDISTGKEFVIRTLYSSTMSRTVPIDLRIKVPKGVLVADVVGSSGTINVANVSGDVNAKTSTGGIQITKVNGFVKAVTSNGKINITEVKGLIEARNSTQDIHVEVPAFRDNLTISSSAGSITVLLSQNISAQLEASAPSKTVTFTDLPLTLSESSPKKIVGKIGAGGGLINIKTSAGSITLKKL